MTAALTPCCAATTCGPGTTRPWPGNSRRSGRACGADIAPARFRRGRALRSSDRRLPSRSDPRDYRVGACSGAGFRRSWS
ncbi:hypothetical protein ACFFX0_21835 [Citricoccus parietis]|uniref:Uncharacterized protein n=1 Tax=Citricoccus parietis TaxID=592307 RepID=A0ABV5G440_9MICC